MAMSESDFAARYQRVYERLYGDGGVRGGYFADTDAAQHGLDAELRDAALERGAVVRVAEGVLRLTIFAPSADERLIVAWQHVGSRGVLSHRSALAAHGLCDHGDTLHLTYPPDATPRARDGVVIHVAVVPPSARVWRPPFPATTLERTFADCAVDGRDASIVARALAKARRRKLVAPSVEPSKVRQAVKDPMLRLALLGALLPLREQTERVGALSPEDLTGWTEGHEIPDEAGGEPLVALKWSDDQVLWPALRSGHDGVIRDLTGIGLYTALETLDLRKSRLESLEPLRELTELTALHVGITETTSLEPLLACKGLRRARLEGIAADASRAERAALEQRGVIVDVARRSPGASPPFEDPMLKLAALEALNEAGLIELPSLVPIDAYELDREHLDRLLALPLRPDQLASIQELVWYGGGMAMQHLVWPQYDGESEEFRIHSLGGIDALPNLRTIRLDATVFDPASPELVALRGRGIATELA